MPIPAPLILVDDDALIREMLTDSLTAEGYRIACAFDGRHALDYLVLRDPDLILSDVAMPRMHGLTLVQRARELGYAMPIILMSASPPPDGLTGVRFAPKPFDFGALTDMVAQELAGTASGATPLPAGVSEPVAA